MHLAAILLAEGDATRGQLLLRAVLRVMAREVQVRGDGPTETHARRRWH